MIEPGVVETELPDHINDEEARAEIDNRLEELNPFQPEDIAAAITYAVAQPERVSVNEILIRPTQQSS